MVSELRILTFWLLDVKVCSGHVVLKRLADRGIPAAVAAIVHAGWEIIDGEVCRYQCVSCASRAADDQKHRHRHLGRRAPQTCCLVRKEQKWKSGGGREWRWEGGTQSYNVHSTVVLILIFST